MSGQLNRKNHAPKIHHDLGTRLESEHLIRNGEEESSDNAILPSSSNDVKITIKASPGEIRQQVDKKEHPIWIRISCAIFYVMSSTVITMANKVVLTTYQWVRSFLLFVCDICLKFI